MAEKQMRGFATMTKAQRIAIARKGGKAVPPEKRSFSQDTALAARAGKVGGSSVPSENRTFSKDAKLAARAGRRGGTQAALNREAAGAEAARAKTRSKVAR